MKKIINVIFSVIFSVLIISTIIKFTVGFKQLYYFDIEYLNIPVLSGLSKEDIKKNYDYMIDYNLDKDNKELNEYYLLSSFIRFSCISYSLLKFLKRITALCRKNRRPDIRSAVSSYFSNIMFRSQSASMPGTRPVKLYCHISW